MTAHNQQRLGKTLRVIADQLRGAMNADDFRDCVDWEATATVKESLTVRIAEGDRIEIEEAPT